MPNKPIKRYDAPSLQAIAWCQAPLWTDHAIDLIKDRVALDKICPVIEHQHRDAHKRVMASNYVRLFENEKLLQFKWQFQYVQTDCYSANVRRKEIAYQSHDGQTRQIGYFTDYPNLKARPLELMTGLGLVSRASPVQTAVRNCTRDE